MSDTTILRDLLSRHDPRAGATVSAEQRNQARINVLAAQHADAAPAGARARSRWMLAFGAVAAAAGLAAVAVFNGGLGGEPAVPAAYADPPPPLNIRVDSLEDGSAILLELAEKAEEQSPPADEGDVAYVSTSEMERRQVSSFEGNESPHARSSAFIPMDREIWQSPDGTCRVAEKPGPPKEKTGDHTEHSEFLELNTSDETHGPGEYCNPLKGSPTDAVAIKEALLDQGDGTTAEDDIGTLVERLNNTVYTKQPVQPASQAGILRLLAEYPEVQFAGRTEDRLGRSGMLFQAESDGETKGRPPFQYRLMFDAETARPLYYEAVQTGELSEEKKKELEDSGVHPPEDLGKYGLELPVLQSYTHYMAAQWVPDLETRP